MDLKSLKSSDIPKIRKELLEKQGFKCAICGRNITENDRITLDHHLEKGYQYGRIRNFDKFEN